jgi:DegV family protein with EDD domain
MTIKVVTDSCSDITQEKAKKLDITVVPAYVHFGDEVYRDGVDIDCDQFYHKLVTSRVHPSTAAASPGDFAKVYEETAKETSEIVSIHVTAKHSAMYDSALVGKEIAEKRGCQIKVIDSLGVTMWQGLVVIAAANAAKAGYSLKQVVSKVLETISQLRALALLDTLRYAVKGGRLGNTIFAIESLLNVKPLITLHGGEIRPAGLTRTRVKGIARLYDFIASPPHIEDLAIVYSSTPDDARALADHARSLFPNLIPKISRLGPTLGVHSGPGALAAIVKKAK